MKNENNSKKPSLRQKAEEQLKQKFSTTGFPLSGTDALKLLHELRVNQIKLEMQNEELKLAKEQSDILNRNYSDLLNFTPIPYYKLSREGEIVDLNLSGAKLLSKGSLVLINSLFGFFLSDDSKPVFSNFLNKVITNKSSDWCEVTMPIEGSTHQSYFYVSGKVDESGENCQITMVDITAQKQTDRALKESEQRFSLFMNHLPALVFIKDSETKVIYVNKSIDVALGASKWLGLKASEIFDCETAERILIDDNNTLKTGYQNIEESFPNLDGKVHHYETQKFVIPRSGQNPLIGGISIDITERKQAERSLQDIIDNNPMSIQVVDSNGFTLKVNQAFKLLYGSVPPSDYSIFNDIQLRNKGFGHLIDSIKNGEVVHFPDTQFNPHDSVPEVPDALVWISTMVFPLVNSNGIPMKFVFMHDNITERRQAEEDLKNSMNELTDAYKQLDRYNSDNKELKQFAYISSHQLQEPLRTISNYIQIIEEDFSGVLDSKALKYFNTIKQSTERMNSLILALSDYSRLGLNKKLQSIDCNKIVNDVIADLQSVINASNASIEVSALPFLKVYEVEFRQLFQNLLANAIKFQKKDSHPEIRIGSEKINGDWLFSVSDNGIGIASDQYEKIFNMYQRLHINEEEYEGKGIGLAFCKKIIELHQGKIWVESELGQGTTVYFTIPNLIL